MHDEKCPYCKGTGEIEDDDPTYIPEEGLIIESTFPCQKCGGTGKLDWIEKVVGKHPTYRFPKGLIVGAAKGSPIPKGWEVCDGSNGTPDLKDCFD